MGKKNRTTDINQKSKSTVDITGGKTEDTLKQKYAVKAAAFCIGSYGTGPDGR